MNLTQESLPGSTTKVSVQIPWTDVETTYKKIMDKLVGEVEVPGFRKGKAPRDLAEKQIRRSSVYEQVLEELIPSIYSQAIKEFDLKPIISPKVEIVEAEENKDWKLHLLIAQKPQINLGDYKKAINELKQAKQKKIWVPGEKKEEKSQELTLAEVFEALKKEIKVELPELLLEQEVNRMLSSLIDQTQKLGLTVEQYLSSQGKTSDQLRSEYREQAKESLALELGLEEIAEAEKVTVEPQEIDEFIKKASNEKEKQELESHKYYISSILRRQKTVAKLLESPIITK